MNRYIILSILALGVAGVLSAQTPAKTQGGTLTGQDQFPIYDYKELPQLEQSNPADWKDIKSVKVFWGDKDFRYPATWSPASVKSTASIKRIKAWRGERVFAQAVISTPVELKNVTYEFTELKGSGESIPASAVEAGYVRFVMADGLFDSGHGCGKRPSLKDFDSTMVADCIDPYLKSMDMAPMQTRTIWMTLWVPSDIPAGKYKGSLLVKVDGKTVKNLGIELVAEEKVLTSPRDWGFHLDLWQNPFAVARYYQLPLWSQAHLDAMRPIMERLANAGQKVITASILHHPWNSQTEDPFESMITWMKKVDGSWEYSFDVFDLWVEYMMSCGIDKQINCYSMAPWKLSFLYLDQATYSLKTISTEPGQPEYAELWGGFLKAFAAHLHEKGWFEMTTIAMDERSMESMLEIIALVREADPDFKISLAGNYYPEIDKHIYDYCVLMNDGFPEGVVEKRRADGKFSTLYTCCKPAVPNTFTFSPPAEGVEIGREILRKKVDGYLRWAYNSWPLEPLMDSRFRSWSSGDTYLVYPGNRTSLRFEHLLEGIQEYEKYVQR